MRSSFPVPFADRRQPGLKLDSLYRVRGPSSRQFAERGEHGAGPGHSSPLFSKVLMNGTVMRRLNRRDASSRMSMIRFKSLMLRDFLVMR